MSASATRLARQAKRSNVLILAKRLPSRIVDMYAHACSFDKANGMPIRFRELVTRARPAITAMLSGRKDARGTTASAWYATAMGAATRASRQFSTATGRFASTQGYQGSFVYGDASTIDTVRTTVANQATWRTIGGFRILTSTGLTTGCSSAQAGGDGAA